MIATASASSARQSLPALRIALYEGTGSRSLDNAARGELLRALLEKGYAVTCIRPGMPVASIFSGELLVLGQFDEEKPAEAEGGDGQVKLHFRQIAGLSVEQVLDVVETVRGQTNAAQAWRVEAVVSGDRL